MFIPNKKGKAIYFSLTLFDFICAMSFSPFLTIAKESSLINEISLYDTLLTFGQDQNSLDSKFRKIAPI
ncbi:hypothetical protein GCM10007049_17900 [Echinicola pacifica]|uniref:Uncharacterized protein n=1 Tax=Echinicola pacifica TaxID=346377 RepID=A0A918PZ12_9BACT|nr:hypothetical protein GCM10007049_17900 [Echinicola pacifica]